MTRHALSHSFGTLFAVAALASCSSSNSQLSDARITTIDGQRASIDSSVLHDDAASPDAAPADASPPDASPPDASPPDAALPTAVIVDIDFSTTCGNPQGLTVGDGDVWMGCDFNLGNNGASVLKFDIANPTLADDIIVSVGPRGVVNDGSHIWSANQETRTVSEIDASTDSVLATISLSSESCPTFLASDSANIWITDACNGQVTKVDIATATVVDTLAVGQSPDDVLFDGTSIWMTTDGTGELHEIDPSSDNVINTISIDATPSGNTSLRLAFGQHALWVLNHRDNSITKVDPLTGLVTNTLALDLSGDNVSAIAVAAGFIWVAESDSNSACSLQKIDPVTGAVVDTLALLDNGYAPAIVFDGTDLWVDVGGPTDHIFVVRP